MNNQNTMNNQNNLNNTALYKSLDPVSKAVVKNVVENKGKAQAPKVTVRCNDCELSFTSHVVLDAHLQGARHAKQLRSKTILAELKQTNAAFSENEEVNGLRCNVCTVYLNSVQQLQTHLTGNRHKKKLEKGDWTGTEIISRVHDPSNVAAPKKQAPVAASTAYPAKKAAVKQPAPAKPAAKNGQTVPGTKLLTCATCNKFFNSPSQFAVHQASRKHLDKISGGSAGNNSNKRFNPYWKKNYNNQPYSEPNTPLNASFVPGGYVHNSSSYMNSNYSPPKYQSSAPAYSTPKYASSTPAYSTPSYSSSNYSDSHYGNTSYLSRY